jgi:hypothetical protein
VTDLSTAPPGFFRGTLFGKPRGWRTGRCRRRAAAARWWRPAPPFREQLLHWSGLPDSSWYNIPKWVKIYQMTIEYTDWPYNIPNCREIDQMGIKYFNIFQCKTLQNLPKLGFLFWKYTTWQAWSPTQAIDRGFDLRLDSLWHQRTVVYMNSDFLVAKCCATPTQR